MKFDYQAKTKSGETQTGIIEASSRETAINLLKSHNLYVTALEEVNPPFYAIKIRIFERISRKEIVVFSRQLAIMFKSEIPLIEVLNALGKQTKNPLMKEKIYEMLERVEGGNSLSKTFSYYPQIFSPFYINMVRSGEISGKLSEIFLYLADYLEKEYDFNNKVKGAMIYPILLLFVFLTIIGLMVYFVIPQMSQFLVETGGEFPRITRFLIAFSSFFRKWGWILILILVSAIGFVYFYSKTKEGKKFFDRNLLKLPVLADFLKSIYLSRISLNLSTLISGGLPIAQALEITGSVVGSEVYKTILSETSEGIKKGEYISWSLSRYFREIPPLFIQTIAAGEKTGQLGLSLKNIFDFYQKEVDRTLDNFMRVLEPILIIIFGFFVGGFVAAIILPIYQIMGTF